MIKNITNRNREDKNGRERRGREKFQRGEEEFEKKEEEQTKERERKKNCLMIFINHLMTLAKSKTTYIREDYNKI